MNRMLIPNQQFETMRDQLADAGFRCLASSTTELYQRKSRAGKPHPSPIEVWQKDGVAVFLISQGDHGADVLLPCKQMKFEDTIAEANEYVLNFRKEVQAL